MYKSSACLCEPVWCEHVRLHLLFFYAAYSNKRLQLKFLLQSWKTVYLQKSILKNTLCAEEYLRRFKL